MFLPELTPDEVERFVALGKHGWSLLGRNEPAAAEAAFRGQLAICPLNPEPFVSLALLEAQAGHGPAALEHLQEAVLRGFTDLRRLEHAEGWTGMGRPPGYLTLIDLIPLIEEVDRRWPGWDRLTSLTVPENVTAVLTHHSAMTAHVEAISPVLGPRLTKLWNRYLDYSAAADLRVYVKERGDAEDFEAAIETLMALYAGGPLQRWERVPADAAVGLAEVASLVLDRFPNSPSTPAALVSRALAWNSERDDRGKLTTRAAGRVRGDLDKVVSQHAYSPLLATAVVGLVQTLADGGEISGAAKYYDAFRRQRADDPETLARAQDQLGDLALRVGGLPDFHATALDGSAVSPATLQGKVVVLDFWATWCGPCVEEFPTLRKIDRRHGDDVIVLGINMDGAAMLSPDALRDWVIEKEVPGTQIQEALSWDSKLVSDFGVKEIPFNVVVNGGGEVVAVNARGKQLEKIVRQAANR